MNITHTVHSIPDAISLGLFEISDPENDLVEKYKAVHQYDAFDNGGTLVEYQDGNFSCLVGNEEYFGKSHHDALMFLINNWLLPC